MPGRARGRARGVVGASGTGDAAVPKGPQARPATGVQRPGTAPPQIQAALLGRGVQGRGVSAEGGGILAGRSRPRVAQAATTVRTVTKDLGAVSLSSSASDLSGSNSNGNGSSSGGNGSNGNGNGNGDDQAIGRGARRGRPADSGVLRTKPATVANKIGDAGQVIPLRANYFKLKKMPNWKIFQYRVDMKPEVDYTKERKYYIRQHMEFKNYFFDGTILISGHPLTVSKDQNLVFTTKRDSDGQMIEVTIRLVGEVSPESSEYLMFMNIIMRNMLEKLQLQLIGRNYFDVKAAIKDPKLMQRKLELYPGYITTIKQQEKDVMLNVEITHKVLRIDSVLDVIKDITRNCRNKANLKGDLEKLLLEKIVITKYNMKTYKISEIDMDMSPMHEFEDAKGNKKTIVQYFRERWNMNISDVNQPMIVSIPRERDMKTGKKKDPVPLVPELCNMTGLSEAQTNDFRLMQDLAVYTRMDPKQRAKSLMGFAKRVHDHPEIKEVLKQWNLEFEQELTSCEGKQIKPEVILGGGKCEANYQVSNADWGNCFRNWQCRQSATLKKWVIIVAQQDKQGADELMNCFNKIFPGLGMTVSGPKVAVIQDNRMNSYRCALEEWQAKKPEMIMVILTKQDTELYSMVKRQCYVQSPVPSQVVTGRVLSKPKGLMSVATKIALQMNCKLGGQLWAVKIPLSGTMFVGYDAFHEGKGDKARSVGALVASLNKDATKYFSTAEFHDAQGAEEVSRKIYGMMTKALTAYKDVNNELPSRIFFYRDGVGEGQIPHVFNSEVNTLQKVIADMNPQIKLTFIITSKRISARFMTAQGMMNPHSGTVVDDVVTNPERYDFYLVSQSVRQGTVNPTSYNVIHDDNNLPAGKMQILTYKLTHLYFNWPGTVRVPAPVQYAHKLAYMVGESLKAKPHAELERELFYL